MAVTLDPGGDGFFTTGVTPVEIVGSPASGTTTTVLSLRYRNADTVAHGWLLELVVGTNRFEIDGVAAGAIGPGDGSLIVARDRVVIIDGPTTTLEFSLREATVALEGHVTRFGLDRIS